MRGHCLVCGVAIQITEERVKLNIRLGVPIEPKWVLCYRCGLDAQTGEKLQLSRVRRGTL